MRIYGIEKSVEKSVAFNNSGSKLGNFGDELTDYNYLALLICILNENYGVNDALVAAGAIDSREDFE